MTSPLGGARSIQLSYRGMDAKPGRPDKSGAGGRPDRLEKVVERMRIELTTFALRTRRSPS